MRCTLLIVGLCLWIATPLQAAVVGGWDLTRGGPYSLSDGSFTSPLRSLLTSVFPDTTFTGSSTLTPGYLSSIDLLVISVAFDDSNPVSPLSAAEQTALHNHVLNGGRALLLGERNDLAAAANASMMNPFGLNINGATFDDPDATVLNPLAVPFTAGPFMVISSVDTTNPGWFDNVGTSTVVATLDSNSQPVLAYFPEQGLAPGSGRLILSADSDIYVNNPSLVLNTFAYLVPEPSGAMLGVLGMIALLVAYKGKRRNSPLK